MTAPVWRVAAGLVLCVATVANTPAQQPLVAPAAGVEVTPVELALPLQRVAQGDTGSASAPLFFDTVGMVLHSNAGQLPDDCDAISADVAITVHAGARHVPAGGPQVFAYDQQSLVAAPCSRVTVTLVNEDAVRHQWLLSGLPEALHPGGVFHLEANGGQRVTGTFIVPGATARYPVFCAVAQHGLQGMQAQLVVGTEQGAALWPLPLWTPAEGTSPGLPAGALVLILAMALTSGSLLLTLPGRKE